MGAFLTRWKRTLGRVAYMPVAFLGVGLYRAWLAIFFRYGAYPDLGFGDYALFEVSIGLTCLAAALLARRIAPPWCNARVMRAAGLLMVAGSLGCAVQSFLLPSAPLKWVSLIAAGAGLAVAILVWCEFYGALNPMRVAIYHAASIFCGELLCWLFMGVEPLYLAGLSVILPPATLYWAQRAVRSLPEIERPGRPEQVRGQAIPWKPIALMATCTFATGFGMLPDQPMLAGNVAGVLFACALVFFGSLSTARWFNFDVIYRLAFPLMTVCLLLVTPLATHSPQVVAFAFDAGYTMLTMFIMIILSNITYRFGIDAVWLNGIERGIRYLVEALGWGAYALSSGLLPGGVNVAVHVGVTAAVVVMFLVIAAGEKSLAAHWGIDLGAGGAGSDVFSPGQLAMRVSDLSKAHGLSDREEEVLQLMARGMTMAQMEEALFVARGTIKAHTHHIYRKFGVRGRDELLALLGVAEGETSGASKTESTR